MILPYRGVTPTVDPTAFVAPGAVIIGDVTIGRDSGIWFNAVVRGDINVIRIGERTNVQDGCILHVASERFGLFVGSEVTVGHGAILHACVVGDGVLVGMGAIVLDGAEVGEGSLVAAGSLVRMGDVIPPGVLAAGSPARVIRPLRAEEVGTIRRTAADYVGYARNYGS